MNKEKSSGKVLSFIGKHPILLVFVAMLIIMSILSPAFFTVTNLTNVLVSEAGRGILALAVGLVIITGGIDLSVAAIAACASCVSASLVQSSDYAQKILPNVGCAPAIIGLLAGLIVGLIVGAFNGAVIVAFNVPPFIATLGGTTIATGFALTYTNAHTVPMISEDFKKIGQTVVGRVPILVIYLVVIFIIAWVLVTKMKFGKCLYAIGGNVNAAIVSGISVKKYTLLAYIWSGVLSGFVGVFLAARSGAGSPAMADGYELDAIAAAVVGGVSTTGGVGTVPGIILGVLLLGVLNNGFLLMGVSPYLQQIIKGFIIVAAVAFDNFREHKRS